MPGSDRPQISCSRGDWKLMTEMPAAMLQKNTSHMIRNWLESTYARVGGSSSAGVARPAAEDADGSAGGFWSTQVTGRSTMPNNTPSDMKTGTRSPFVAPRSSGASTLLITKAPTPNPMTTTPVTRPRLSGNHFATVETGVT